MRCSTFDGVALRASMGERSTTMRPLTAVSMLMLLILGRRGETDIEIKKFATCLAARPMLLAIRELHTDNLGREVQAPAQMGIADFLGILLKIERQALQSATPFGQEIRREKYLSTVRICPVH